MHNMALLLQPITLLQRITRLQRAFPEARTQRAGALGSIMIPASVLMAVSVYDRASDSMYLRFFGIFRSSFCRR